MRVLFDSRATEKIVDAGHAKNRRDHIAGIECSVITPDKILGPRPDISAVIGQCQAVAPGIDILAILTAHHTAGAEAAIPHADAVETVAGIFAAQDIVASCVFVHHAAQGLPRMFQKIFQRQCFELPDA